MLFYISLSDATLTLCVDESCCRCISVMFRDALQLLILHSFHLHLFATFPRSVRGEHSERRSDEETRVFLIAWKQLTSSSSSVCCSPSSERDVFTFLILLSRTPGLQRGKEMLLFSSFLEPIGSQRKPHVCG